MQSSGLLYSPRQVWLRFGVLIAILGIPAFGIAQSITNLKAEFANKKVILIYDITGATANQSFDIQVFGSHDNFAAPLKQVSGDVGKNVKGGTAKRIEWDPKGELTVSDGDISFRLIGYVAAPPLRISSPERDVTIKRGSTLAFAWEGGSPGQVVVDVVQGNTVIARLPKSDNTGKAAWNIPKSTKKGAYQLRIVSGSQTAVSESFVVKPQITRWAFVAPVVVAGAIILFWPDKPPVPEDDLPIPPGPK